MQEWSNFSTTLPAFGVTTTAFTLLILMGAQFYLIVDLICVSLISNDVSHIFICSFAICITALGKCLFMCVTHFLTGLFA